MSVEPNPYSAPPEIRADGKHSGEESVLWGIGFWIGIVLLLMGFVAAFLPNAPPVGFMLVALFLFVAVSFGSARYRKRAIVGVLLCLAIGVGTVYQIRSARADMLRQQTLQARFEAARAAEEAARAAAERAVQARADSATRP